jgi:cytosine/uracil/thiamine/allantoin permease
LINFSQLIICLLGVLTPPLFYLFIKNYLLTGISKKLLNYAVSNLHTRNARQNNGDYNMTSTREENGMIELTQALPKNKYTNEDIAPTPIKVRTWKWWHISALWIGMSVCIPTYMLAAGLISAGMNWIEALLTILLGNLIVLIPMGLNGHAGTKYGVPFPVLIRSSFGLMGAHIPSIARALVACGWFGIQTWVGGKALFTLTAQFYSGIIEWGPGLRDIIGINGGELFCFLVFWLIQILIVLKGTESIKWVESAAAPILIIIGLCLIIWAAVEGDGLGRVLDQSSRFQTPTISAHHENNNTVVVLNPLKDENGSTRATQYRLADQKENLANTQWQPMEINLTLPKPIAMVWVEFRDEKGHTALVSSPVKKESTSGGSWLFLVFFPLLTAMVGYWATLSLNIPDFTRYAKNQKSQLLGQMVGLPPTMTLYSFVGIVSTCASILLFSDVLVQEQAPWDPVDMLAHFDTPLMLVISMFFLAIATLTTNIAANVVAPANSFSNVSPKKISFKLGGLLTGFVGIIILPWKILENAGAYIFTWLIGYSALMGGIAGVMICDYFLIRRRKLKLDDLYRDDGLYSKWRWQGIIAFVAGVLPNIPGFINAATTPGGNVIDKGFFDYVYTYAWFVSFGISFAVYYFLSLKKTPEEYEYLKS